MIKLRSLAMSAVLLTCLILGCQKKSQNTINSGPITVGGLYQDYTVLKQGNYWIYQQYRIEGSVVTADSVFDSCYVVSDTAINSHNYHHWFSPGTDNVGITNSYNEIFARDSASYLVSPSGGILFSSSDYSTIFNTKISYPNSAHSDTETVTYQMGYKDSSITVPAGTFTTSTMREVFHFQPPYTNYGLTRDYDRTYASGKGLIKSTIALYFASPVVFEWRLIRYHVQ